MTWLANHPFLFASLFIGAGVLSREIMAFLWVGMDALFFSLAVFSEVLRSF